MRPEAIPLIALTGGPFERGLAHGRACAAEIRQMLEAWRIHVGPPGSSTEGYLGAFRTQTDFLKGFEDHAPHLVDELRGIAEGAGVAFRQILDLQLLDEEWWFRQLHQPSNAGIHHHCSALALRTPDGAIVAAQNFDGAGWMEGFQRIFHHRDPARGFEALVFSLPGMLALNGVNREGVAVCVNSLIQLDGDPAGLPVVGVIRRILESSGHDEAVRTLRTVRHASGQNYVIADRNGFGSYEASQSSIAEVISTPDRAAVWHTNHPLANRDDDRWRQATAQDSPDRRLARTANSRARLAALESRLGAGAAIPVEGVKSLLASRQNSTHPLSRELGGGGDVIDYTVACAVFELRPAAALMHFAAGPPSITEFRTFSCDIDGSLNEGSHRDRS